MLGRRAAELSGLLKRRAVLDAGRAEAGIRIEYCGLAARWLWGFGPLFGFDRHADRAAATRRR